MKKMIFELFRKGVQATINEYLKQFSGVPYATRARILYEFCDWLFRESEYGQE